MRPTNTLDVAAAIRRAQKRGLEAETFTDYEDLGKAWQEVFRGLGTFKSASYITLGLAEKCLALLEGTKGFEVGIGECLRPYISCYRGPDETRAVTTFLAYADAMRGYEG